jgi:hypothetical protein
MTDQHWTNAVAVVGRLRIDAATRTYGFGYS